MANRLHQIQIAQNLQIRHRRLIQDHHIRPIDEGVVDVLLLHGESTFKRGAEDLLRRPRIKASICCLLLTGTAEAKVVRTAVEDRVETGSNRGLAEEVLADEPSRAAEGLVHLLKKRRHELRSYVSFRIDGHCLALSPGYARDTLCPRQVIGIDISLEGKREGLDVWNMAFFQSG